MKIGITINDNYKDFLEESANLNNTSITTLCGLILENFLSFNKKNKRIPVVNKIITISMKKNEPKTSSGEKHPEIEKNQYNNTENASWEEMIADLESMNPED